MVYLLRRLWSVSSVDDPFVCRPCRPQRWPVRTPTNLVFQSVGLFWNGDGWKRLLVMNVNKCLDPSAQRKTSFLYIVSIPLTFKIDVFSLRGPPAYYTPISLGLSGVTLPTSHLRERAPTKLRNAGGLYRPGGAKYGFI